MEFTLVGAAFVAVAAMWVVIYWEAPRGNASVVCDRGLWDIAVTAAVIGAFTGRLWSVVANGGNPFTAPADLLIIRAGVATGPATVAAVATVAWLARGNARAIADAIAPAALAGLAGWHGSCLFRDACLGTATDLPWALTQAGSTVGRHPVELYSALILVGASLLLVLVKSTGRATAPGAIAAAALATAAGSRLVTEPFRPSLSGGPIGWYWTGLVVAVAVTILVIVTRSDESHTSAVHSPP